jgi:phosphoglycerol transferase
MQWPLRRKSQLDLLVALGLAGLVSFEWGLAYRIFDFQRFGDPLSYGYGGDAWYAAGLVSAAAHFDFLPFVSKNVESLGAPFVANWNDFPASEDVIYFFTGVAARWLGVFGAINVAFALACILAAVSFFFVARAVRLNRAAALTFGALYGLSTFAFARTVHHFSLLFFWVFPPWILTMFWLSSRQGIVLRSRKMLFAALTAVLVSGSMVYYLYFALQLFAFVALGHFFRRGRNSQFKSMAALTLVLSLGFLSVNADTVMFWFKNGQNQTAIARAPTDGEYFALKPIAFFTPPHIHRLEAFRNFSASAKKLSVTSGEVPSPYLGVVGGFCLLALALHALRCLGRQQFDRGLLWAACVAALMLINSVGSVNGIFSLLGFNLFRSVNRVSIVIQAFVLLFGCWKLSRFLSSKPRWIQWGIALPLAVFGAFEQVPSMNGEPEIRAVRRIVESDRSLVAAAEAVLPAGAKVFQLPATDFPEGGFVHAVEGYEMFRPYFFSRRLKFSFGNMRGRPDAQWKLAVAQLPPAQMVERLRSEGFAAIYVNLKGYPDGGAQLVKGFAEAGLSTIARAEIGDSLFLSLGPQQ